MSEAPLHPRRIQATLDWLGDGGPDDSNMPDEVYQTLRAALKLLQKAQAATGLTPEVADVGSHVLGVLDYVKRGLTRK